MILYSRVSVAPASEPITLEEAKAFLRVDGTDEDALITSLISVARSVCETYAGLSFAAQTRVVKLDRFPCSDKDIILPYGPVTAVTSVAYSDEDGNPQTVASGGYTVDMQSGLSKIRITESWPSTDRIMNNVVVTYTAGYATVPEVAKHAIKMTLASLYENRQDEVVGTVTTLLNWNSQALLDTIKVYWDAEV
jgi:uncharacterized phiE125 gp8 family phage protein